MWSVRAMGKKRSSVVGLSEVALPDRGWRGGPCRRQVRQREAPSAVKPPLTRTGACRISGRDFPGRASGKALPA